MSQAQFSFRGIGSMQGVSGALGSSQGQNFNSISRNVPVGTSDRTFSVRRTQGNPVVQSYTTQPTVPSFRNVQSQVMSKFSNRISTSSLPNLQQMMSGTGSNLTYQSNRPNTYTIIPRPFSGTPYDKFLMKGDIIFGWDDDKLKDLHRQTPARTVMNFQSLNRHLYIQKAFAVNQINRLMQKKTSEKPEWPPYIDYDMLIRKFKDEKSHLYENRMVRMFDVGSGVNRKTEKIMEERVKKLQNVVKSITNSGGKFVSGVGFIDGIMTDYKSALDNNVNGMLLYSLNDFTYDTAIHLHPAMLSLKYKYLGSIMNMTPHRDDVIQSYSLGQYEKQKIATVVSGGPAEILNVFGPVNSYKNKFRGKMNSTIEFAGPKLNKMSQLHLAYVHDGSENLHTYRGTQFRPTWLIPFCSTSKKDLINQLENRYPLYGETSIYTGLVKRSKNSKIRKRTTNVWIPRSQPTSYYLGKLIDLSGPDPSKKSGYFTNAWGTTNWSNLMSMDPVLKLRKKAGLIKIDVKQI